MFWIENWVCKVARGAGPSVGEIRRFAPRPKIGMEAEGTEWAEKWRQKRHRKRRQNRKESWKSSPWIFSASLVTSDFYVVAASGLNLVGYLIFRCSRVRVRLKVERRGARGGAAKDADGDLWGIEKRCDMIGRRKIVWWLFRAEIRRFSHHFCGVCFWAWKPSCEDHPWRN